MHNHIGYCPTNRWGELTDAERKDLIKEFIQLFEDLREDI